MQIAELYPTSHRAVGIGVASLVSLIIGVSAPYIAYSVSTFGPLSLDHYLLTIIIGPFWSRELVKFASESVCVMARKK